MNEIKRNAEAAKKAAELSKKIETEKRRNERLKGYLEGDIKNGRDTTKSALDLKYSSKYLSQMEKERQKELDKMK